MFHGFKSLVFSAGYREKSHECLIIAVGHLFIDTGILPSTIRENISLAKNARELADYGLQYNEHSARETVTMAEETYSVISVYLDEQGYS
jgi:uncharacterized protein (UPF0332 family)